MKRKNKLALIVAYYISKYDKLAYKNLGFGSITGTHANVGKILGIKGTTIQNMRDEFDPQHDNPRKGWWQRGLTASRKAILDKFEGYSELQLRRVVEQIIRMQSGPDNISDELDSFEISNSQSKGYAEWTDEELELAISSYLYLLKIRFAGIQYPSSNMTKHLLDGPLKIRRRSALRTRMRNISDVLLKMGFPILDGYTPAPDFGKNVRRRIQRILDQHLDELKNLTGQDVLPQVGATNTDLEEILSKLDNLEKNIDTLRKPAIEGLGHNNPPSPIEDDIFGSSEVKESIENIRNELRAEKSNKKSIKRDQNILLAFGFKLAAWSKDRVTEFSKAVAVAAGTGFGVWLTGLGSEIVETVKTLVQYLAG